MSCKKKAKIEKEYVDMLLKKGGVKCYVCMIEGQELIYQMQLANGETRYWVDFGSESLERLGLKEG